MKRKYFNKNSRNETSDALSKKLRKGLFIMKASIIISAMLVSGSCTESYIDGYDVSPNYPSDVPLTNLLSATEVALFGNVTGEFARVTSVFMQSQAGLTNQSLEEHARYQIYEGDNQNDWESIYTDWMDPATDLIARAGTENPWYKGIGLILKAWSGAFLSDLYDDIPFSEAILGLENMNPHYDSQEVVFEAVQKMLNEAIMLLSKPESDNSFLPSGDDLIFNGNAAKWTKLAWALKARYFNRISKRFADSADSVLVCVQNAITTNADNTYAVFGETANNANQWYAFYVLRPGYMGMGEYLIEKMKASSDPRLSFYSAQDVAGNYSGSGNDTRVPKLDASVLGPLYNESAKPVPLITAFEVKFLEAEAKLRNNDKSAAAEAYNDAVKLSVKWVTGADAPPAFVASNASENNTTITLQKII